METDRLIPASEEKKLTRGKAAVAAMTLSAVFFVSVLSNRRSLKQAPISMNANEKRVCVGHAALTSLHSFSEISTPSKQAYAERFGYDLVVLEATTRWKLGKKFCPALEEEVSGADERTALRYCFMWHALKVRGCEWAVWTDPEALIVSEEPLQVSSGDDAVWFMSDARDEAMSDTQDETTSDAQDEANEDGSCGTADHFASVVDVSVSMLRNNRWVDGFIHYKLALGNMEHIDLRNCLREAESSQTTRLIKDQCAENRTSMDQCTTGCLYRYQPDWLAKASCRSRPSAASLEAYHNSRDARPFFTFTCDDDRPRENQLECLKAASSTIFGPPSIGSS